VSPFDVIPVGPVILTGSVICGGIGLVVLNARSRAVDPDIRAGLGLLLVSVGVLLLGSIAVLMRGYLTFAASAFAVATAAIVCHVFGYAALLRGAGRRPPPWLMAVLVLGPMGIVGVLLQLGLPVWLILSISSCVHMAVITGIIWHLHAVTIQMGRAQMLLATQPFGLILTVYAARMAVALTTADEGLLVVLTLALGFVLCFATLTWCFGLMAFGLERLSRSLRAERQRAEAASRIKSEFLANMSHEVRTPLNGILGMAQLLDDRIRGPTEREMLAVIRQSGEGLLHVLNDILDLSKVEAGRLDLDPAPFRPAELIDRIERLYRLQAEDKQLTLEVRSAPALDRLVLGDANRILQVLHNLMGNALKFTEHGRVQLLAGWRDALPAEGCGPGAGWLELTVADTGIGMSPEQQERVFEDFVQADGSITRRYGGTGLGLSLSRRLIGLMGGTIRLESQLGVGTRFVIRLPLRPAAAPAAAAGPAPTGAAPEQAPGGAALPAAAPRRAAAAAGRGQRHQPARGRGDAGRHRRGVGHGARRARCGRGGAGGGARIRPAADGCVDARTGRARCAAPDPAGPGRRRPPRAAGAGADRQRHDPPDRRVSGRGIRGASGQTRAPRRSGGGDPAPCRGRPDGAGSRGMTGSGSRSRDQRSRTGRGSRGRSITGQTCCRPPQPAGSPVTRVKHPVRDWATDGRLTAAIDRQRAGTGVQGERVMAGLRASPSGPGRPVSQSSEPSGRAIQPSSEQAI
jgi:signal transduction histidine kinase